MGWKKNEVKKKKKETSPEGVSLLSLVSPSVQRAAGAPYRGRTGSKTQVPWDSTISGVKPLPRRDRYLRLVFVSSLDNKQIKLARTKGPLWTQQAWGDSQCVLGLGLLLRASGLLLPNQDAK